MNVNNCDIVTTSGDSESQMPAVGSEQTGSRRSSSSDRRTSGVDSQAPDGLNATSAANCHSGVERQKNGPDDRQRSPTMKAELQAVQYATKALKLQLVTQDGGLKLLFKQDEDLKLAAKKTHSPTVSTAISELLEVIGALRDSHECVNNVCNELTKLTKDLATLATSDQSASESVQTPCISTVDACTDIPRRWGDPANIQISNIVPGGSSEQGTSEGNQQGNRGNWGQRTQQQQAASNSKSAKKSVPELDPGTQESEYTLVQSKKEKKKPGKQLRKLQIWNP